MFVFKRKTIYEIPEEVVKDIEKCILTYANQEKEQSNNELKHSIKESEEKQIRFSRVITFDSYEVEVNDSFQKRLFKYIDDKGLSDPKVYRKAGIDRKLFSKIRCNEDYIPGKDTICALGLALELSLADMKLLLDSAGYSLSHSFERDIIIEYCCINRISDNGKVNAILEKFGERRLNE